MKWWKTLIGILLITAALAAIYFWNYRGREKMAQLEAEKAATEVQEEIKVDPRKEVLINGKAYFVIPYSKIYCLSSYIQAGDTVGLYDLSKERETIEEAKICSVEIATVGDSFLEVICSLGEYDKFLSVSPLLVSLEAIYE